MKRFVILLMLLGTLCTYSEELSVANPMKQLVPAWKQGKLNGKNKGPAMIGDKLYEDAWEFFYVSGGHDYKDAVLKPLIGLSPDSKGAKAWGEKLHLAAATKEDGGFLFPSLIGFRYYIYHTKCTWGGAYSLRNPLGKKAKLYVEGCFWHNPDAKIYIYIQRKNGEKKLLSDDTTPEAVLEYEKRHYLKMQYEDELEPDDSIVFMGLYPPGMGKYIEKGIVIFNIAGWGDAWNPIISLEPEETTTKGEQK